IAYYALAEERSALTAQVFTTARRTAETGTPGSDAQLAWTRLAIALGGEDQAGYLAGLLDGGVIPAGLTVDTDLRWAAWISLAAAGKADEAELDAELAREDTARSRRQRAKGLAARPSEAAKAAAWDAVVERDDEPNAMVSAIVAGFARPAQRALTQPYVERYFGAIEELWNTRTIEIARRLVVGLYPGAQDIELDRAAAEHPVVRRTDRWLNEHPDVSASLRRLVIEERDHLVRSLRGQECERSSR
ncbi:MAG: ERAP1-like C-terminal domain-containing protein, partial [Jiangellaceae bacterium]